MAKNRYILLAISIVLLIAAFLTKSFPIIIFAALAPLFALTGKVNKLSLIFFWLALEYLELKFFADKHVFFLADAVYEKTEWLRWTNWTGYLGASLWILLANYFLYLGLLQNGLRVPYLVVFLIVIVGPILYSYTLQSDYVARLNMLLLYMNGPTSTEGYNARGEWIPRTAAWISVLILISAVVRNNIRKK
ncbi:MAG TPA: hypothetical protein VFE50_00565 [Cyclobacteriaceae bacterium]|nr:hypothetical protein [Cyclobacteriaceae bacterium]